MTVQPGRPPAECMDAQDACLPEPLESLLLAARAQERVASGIDRRTAFRTTRIVVGALREAGYSAVAIAGTLGISVDSARARAELGGFLSKEMICTLTGLNRRQFAALARRHRLTSAELGTPSMFRMLDVVRALHLP